MHRVLPILDCVQRSDDYVLTRLKTIGGNLAMLMLKDLDQAFKRSLRIDEK